MTATKVNVEESTRLGDSKRRLSSKKADKNANKRLLEQVDSLKMQLARVLADYDNLQKRFDREKESVFTLASAGFVIKLLPIVDMLQSAQEHIADSGLAIAIDNLKSLLKEEGFEEKMAQKGDDFDESLFEAVEAIEPKSKKLRGRVAELVLSGWVHESGKVIRPVKVKVYSK